VKNRASDTTTMRINETRRSRHNNLSATLGIELGEIAPELNSNNIVRVDIM